MKKVTVAVLLSILFIVLTCLITYGQEVKIIEGTQKPAKWQQEKLQAVKEFNPIYGSGYDKDIFTLSASKRRFVLFYHALSHESLDFGRYISTFYPNFYRRFNRNEFTRKDLEKEYSELRKRTDREIEAINGKLKDPHFPGFFLGPVTYKFGTYNFDRKGFPLKPQLPSPSSYGFTMGNSNHYTMIIDHNGFDFLPVNEEIARQMVEKNEHRELQVGLNVKPVEIQKVENIKIAVLAIKGMVVIDNKSHFIFLLGNSQRDYYKEVNLYINSKDIHKLRQESGGIEFILQPTIIGVPEINTKIADIIRRRIEQYGRPGSFVTPLGKSKVLVRIPFIEGLPNLGYFIEESQQLTKLIESEGELDLKKVIQVGAEGKKLTPHDRSEEAFPDRENRLYIVEKESLLPGTVFQDAFVKTKPNGDIYIQLELTPQGGKELAKVVKSLKLGDRLAIVLDDVIQDTVVVDEKMAEEAEVRGEVEAVDIEGNFNKDQAERLAIIVRNEALPTNCHIVGKRPNVPLLRSLGKLESARNSSFNLDLGIFLGQYYFAKVTEKDPLLVPDPAYEHLHNSDSLVLITNKSGFVKDRRYSIHRGHLAALRFLTSGAQVTVSVYKRDSSGKGWITLKNLNVHWNSWMSFGMFLDFTPTQTGSYKLSIQAANKLGNKYQQEIIYIEVPKG